ncbi:MAG TPA: alpha/beta hydrolase [Sphingomonas sp.]|nr:alpha/beta hydrolase [Sphingomonas sp.]
MPAQAASISNPRRSIPKGMSFASWTAADGWPLRSFSWPRRDAARGSILFLGGRGDFVEKYLEALAHWHAQGWDLAGFDWRGQGGSGRLLSDPLICHQIDFDPLVDDLAAFVRQWKAAAAGPHVIVAHSMGAHLTLRMLARGEPVDAVVLASPMVDIRVKGIPGWLLGAIAAIVGRLGMAERRIWRRDIGDVGGRMTSCPERRADKAWWKAASPEIASGVPSWQWMHAARVSIRRLCPADLRSIATPALILMSERDPVVDVRAIQRLAEILPHAESMCMPGGGHELLREADHRRLPVFARIDSFLDKLAADNPP